MSVLIPQLVDAHAALTPDAAAIEFLEQRLNYLELQQASNQLANCLLKHGVVRGDRVGIYMDKCLESAVAMYGIMKAGAAYVPLDALAPATRIADIIEDCDIKLLISADNKRSRLGQMRDQLSRELLVLGASAGTEFPFPTLPWSDIFERYPAESAEVKIIESDLAYIIYTSGSTGKPKGIMHTHHSGLSFARWAAQEYGLLAHDRLSNHAPLHFDLSIFDYFAGAVAGACTVIIPEEYTKLPASYSELLASSRVSVLFTVPFALIQLSLRGALEQRQLQSLRWVLFGGEPFPVKYLRQLMAQLPGARFDNIYGPAEVNGCSHYTVGQCEAEKTAVPIGRICQIAEAMVVDANDASVATGEIGELLVRTPTMMQGYWGRPDLNQKVFLRLAESTAVEQVFYRTGDLVQVDSDQTMWFIGRKDRQVKVRGYRIELDEVEAALAAHDDVEEAAVYSVLNGEESAEIRAAATLKAGSDTTVEQLSAHLKTRLPAYAVPATLNLRQEFPRTSTGKIDRRSLSQQVSV